MYPTRVVGGKNLGINISNNKQRRFSIISKNFDNEYDNQTQIEVLDSQLSQPLPSADGLTNRRRLTQIISIVDHHDENVVKPKGRNLLLFMIEPILTGCILFPLLVLFWDCGWNLFVTMLNSLNNYTLTYNLDGQNYTDYGYGEYSPQSLVVSYVVGQTLLLILYLSQDLLYNFLKKQHQIIEMLIIKIHILLLASLYIVQWEMIWTILDQYTSSDWGFMLVLSLSAVFVLIVITGTLSDLVCSPLVISYDSIECCIQFECPLQFENVSIYLSSKYKNNNFILSKVDRWKINLINFIFYEIIVSNITIIAWHGFYSILDQYLYPDDIGQSIWICVIIGYLLYFPLMYCQYPFERFDIKNKYWKMLLTNFPQFHRNFVHALSFAACVFIWRAFWVSYDTYLRIFDAYHDTYLLISLLTFLFLSLIQTFSSMNGPLKTMEDHYQFFPVYPHCYVSTVVYKLSRFKCFQLTNSKISPFQNSENENNNRW
jgi:hypothetical protein